MKRYNFLSISNGFCVFLQDRKCYVEQKAKKTPTTELKPVIVVFKKETFFKRVLDKNKGRKGLNCK
jgi:hypothetical protein